MKTFIQFIAEAQQVHSFSDTILKHWERIPFVIRSTMWNRIFPDSIETTAFHITSTSGFENLVKRQGRKNAISTFNKIDNSAIGGEWSPHGNVGILSGIETDGQVLLKLKGKQGIEFGFDAWTARTDKSHRTIMLGDSIWHTVYAKLDSEHKKIFDGLKVFLGNRLKMMIVLKNPEQMDGREKQKFIKDYLDATEQYIRKHSDEIRDLFTKRFGAYNEVVLEFPKILKAYIIDDGSFDPKRAIQIAVDNKISHEFIPPGKIAQKLSSDSDLRVY